MTRIAKGIRDSFGLQYYLAGVSLPDLTCLRYGHMIITRNDTWHDH